MEKSWYARVVPSVPKNNLLTGGIVPIRLQRATWHVPPGQIPVAQHGAAAAPETATNPGESADSLRPELYRTDTQASSSSRLSVSSVSKGSNKAGKNSAQDSGLTVEVALKVIPKKKVKGNEDSVWGEMEVLKGLNHPNIVSLCNAYDEDIPDP